MSEPIFRLLLVVGVAALMASPLRAQTTRITVDPTVLQNHLTRDMTGSCIEDVNHEIYGGLYDQKIFGESFEEPPPPAKFADWNAYGGDWQPEGDGCRVSASAGAKLVYSGSVVGDGVIAADLRFPNASGDNAGLLVRVHNPGVGADNFDGYEISLRAGGGQVVLGKHVHGWQPLETAPLAIAAGQWRHLAVRLDGPRIRIFVDGNPVPVIDFTDTDHPLPPGALALRTWNSDVVFRHVTVQTGAQATPCPLKADAVIGLSGMWDPIHNGSATAGFFHDAQNPYNGAYCQRIEHGPGAGEVGFANRGLNHWGISVVRGKTYEGRVYLRGASFIGTVKIALQSADGSRTYGVTTLRGIGAAWGKFPFRLTSKETDADARFALWMDRPGTLWCDQTVLMDPPADRFHGLPLRADIANGLVSEGLTFLRYAGTMVNVPGYRWKNMIGDPDRRPPYPGNWYPYATNGFGIFDFLNFCEAAHISSAFAINCEETDQDAADLADYLTAPVSNPWGRRRAEDGHPAPYHPEYIEIGNEEVIGDGRDAAGFNHYADRFRALAAAIHGRNPALKLVCAAWWVADSPNMKTVFNTVDGRAAAWDLHVGSDDARSGAAIDRQLAQMQSLFRQWNPQTSLKCVVFEENGGLHSQQRALGHATTLNATRRHGDFVLADCPANCLQPWQQNDNGWDQGQLFFTPDHVWPMPPYFAQQMAAENYEPLRVRSAVSGNAAGDLDVLAARSQDGQTLVITVVNVGAVDIPVTLALGHFVAARATATTLAGDLRAVNTPTGPPMVRPRAQAVSLSGGGAGVTIPAHSYSLLRFTR